MTRSKQLPHCTQYNVNTTFVDCLYGYLEVMVMLAVEYSSSETAAGANKYTLESGGKNKDI